MRHPTRTVVVAAALAAFAWILSGSATAAAQDVPPPGPALEGSAPAPPAATGGEAEDVEVLMQGPVHEAFAEQINADPEPTPVVTKEPPEPIDEVPPDMRPEGNNIVWVPGYWLFDPDREDFVWVSGTWRKAPPNRRWVPGYWDEVDEGWQWVPGTWVEADADELAYQPPPPESIEEGPSSPAPSEEHFWVPGTWMYYDTGYRWRAGYWARGYDDWIWVPAHYVWTPYGVIYVPGYWDYLWDTRGLLFAPVYFHRPLYLRPGFRYAAHVALSPGRLFLHLWVRPRWRHYYFGDYYAARYGGWGFYPWYRFHVHHRYHPMWTFYAWNHHRRGIDLSVRLGGWHSYYTRHVDLRPPRVYGQLDAFVARHRGQAHLQQAVLGGRLRDLSGPDLGRVRLTRLDRNQIDAVARSGSHFRDLSRERLRIEGAGRGGPGDRVRLGSDAGPGDRIAGGRLKLPRESNPLGLSGVGRRGDFGDRGGPRIGDGGPRIGDGGPRIRGDGPGIGSGSPRIGSSGPRIGDGGPRVRGDGPGIGGGGPRIGGGGGPAIGGGRSGGSIGGGRSSGIGGGRSGGGRSGGGRSGGGFGGGRRGR